MSESTASAASVAGKKQTEDIQIIVNGAPHNVESERVSFEQVVSLAYPTPPSPDTLFSVTFRNAKEPKEGSLVQGRTVEVKEHGTIFNVTATGKS